LVTVRDGLRRSLTQANLGRYGGCSCLGFPVKGVLLYQSLKMIKTRTPHGKFSIYPAHPFLICTVQYCPRFHFPEFDGRSKACSSTDHGTWALENTRRRPPLGPASRLYHPCISRNQPAPLSDHSPLPRGGVEFGGVNSPPPTGFVPVRKRTPPFLTGSAPDSGWYK